MNIFLRVASSVQARYIIPYQQNHFEKIIYGKKLTRYKSKYTGRRCFFIGNGPSLRAEDLTRLKENGEITFAFNRIYNIFDQTLWRPDFYISQDEKMLAGCADIVCQLKAEAKFIPIQFKWWHNISIDNAVYFNLENQNTDKSEDMQFSDEIACNIYNSSTCMYTAAQIAAYMGFKEIYLIGVDHHFHISQNNQGQIVIDSSVKDYFTDKYNTDKDQLYIPNTERSTLTYIAMKKHCDERGINVFNATRGGKLEVFERIDFETLF